MRIRAEVIVLDRSLKNVYLGYDKHGFPEMPGGGKEEGETTFEAAKREVKEEIGVEVRHRISSLPPFLIETKQWTSIIKTYICTIKRKNEELHGNGPEGKLIRKKMSFDKAISEFQRRLDRFPDLNDYGERLTKRHMNLLAQLRDSSL